MTNEKHAVDRTREELKQEIHAYKDESSVLSPAAQAIEDAVDNAWSNSRARAAAAIRAAADQLGYSNVPEEFAHMRPKVIEVDDLLAIADELESQ